MRDDILIFVNFPIYIMKLHASVKGQLKAFEDGIYYV